MTSSPTIALAATLHDPSGALATDIRRYLPRLAERYVQIAVATSPPTARAIRRFLAREGADAGTPVDNARGPLYRLALRRALTKEPSHVHYLDFDRVLHWEARRPRELAATLRLVRRHRAILLGRTRAAHCSHHRPLYATEVVTNALLAGHLGLDGRVDFLVPSFVLPAAAVRELLRRSRARGNTVYGEWAALVAGLAPELAYLECRGLDWETPDRHRRAVRRVGLAAWRRRQDTPAEWRARTEMAADILRGVSRVLATGPVPKPALRRLAPRLG